MTQKLLSLEEFTILMQSCLFSSALKGLSEAYKKPEKHIESLMLDAALKKVASLERSQVKEILSILKEGREISYKDYLELFSESN